MAPLPSREALQSMKRSDLQKLCKDYGVRANLKSEAIIDLLIQTQSAPAPVPHPAARQRSISTRNSSRAGPSRIASVIIHDIEEEYPKQVEETVNEAIEDVKPYPPVKPQPRTRKAKELQKHLGVGRPVAAGGTGPRAVTRSITVSRNKGLRNSQSLKQMEATIAEELEGPNNELGAQPIRPATIDTMPSSSSDTQPQVSHSMHEKQDITNSFLPHFEKLLSNAIKPLQEQIQTLQAEVKRMQSLELDLSQLRRQLSHLRTESGRRLSMNPSTPPATTSSNPHILTNDIHAIRRSPPPISKPGPAHAPVLLGKRQRDLSIEETDEAGQRSRSQGYPDNQVLQSPLRKRPKLMNEPSTVKGKEKAPASSTTKEYLSGDNENPSSNAMTRVTSFIVYNDPEDEPLRDSPPTLLPDYYTSQTDSLNANSNSPKPVPSTSSANAPENLNPFQFSFGPSISTPSQSFIPVLPYPEPPQSPSPAGQNIVSLNRNTPDRTDIFKSFGLPPPDRGGRLPTGTQPGNTINPAALSQRDPMEKSAPSSNEIGASLGLIPLTPALRAKSSSGEVPVAKKTMYGTELEGNTRFGDFGVEGVANGFWTGGRL